VALRVLIEDLQVSIDAQTGPTPRTHSYTNYNSWDKVRHAPIDHTTAFTFCIDMTFLLVLCYIFFCSLTAYSKEFIIIN
jgi:hypothetical protein